jgi:hypothetical protein
MAAEVETVHDLDDIAKGRRSSREAIEAVTIEMIEIERKLAHDKRSRE